MVGKPIIYFESIINDDNSTFRLQRRGEKGYIKIDKRSGVITKKGYENTIVKFRVNKAKNSYEYDTFKVTIINPDNLPVNVFKKCMVFRCTNVDLLKNKPRDYFESLPEWTKDGFVYVDYSDIKTFDKKHLRLVEYSQYRYDTILAIYNRKVNRIHYQY